MSVIICWARGFPVRRILQCPTCKKRRRFAGIDEAWYGTTITCCACGDTWSSGERTPRPTRRGWRKEAAAKAKAQWIEAGRYSKADHEKWLKAELGWDEPAEAQP